MRSRSIVLTLITSKDHLRKAFVHEQNIPSHSFHFQLGTHHHPGRDEDKEWGSYFLLQPSLKVAFPLSLSNDIPLDGSLANNITLLRRQTDPEEDIEGKRETHIGKGRPVRPEVLWHNPPTICCQTNHSHLVHDAPINL